MKKRELIQKEIKEVIVKSEELYKEIGEKTFQTLSPTKQQLLKEQYGIYTNLRQVLALRLHYGVEETK